MKLIVNTPEPMWRMRVVTTKELAPAALQALQRAGVLHAETAEGPRAPDRASIAREREVVAGLLADIGDVLAYVPADAQVRVDADMEVFLTRGVREIEKETRSLCTKLSAMHRRAEKLEADVARARRLGRIVEKLSGRMDIAVRDLSFSGSTFVARLLLFPREIFAEVEDALGDTALACETVDLAEETAVFVLCKREKQRRLNELISRGGEELVVPRENAPLREFGPVAASEAAKTERELAALRDEIEERTSEHLEDLILLREGLAAENERLTLLEQALATGHVVVIEGWVPQSVLDAADEHLRAEIEAVHIETRRAESAEEPPSKLRNPSLLRPFEVVVNLFATPRYREWDPTPAVAYFFAFFFGVMLGDAVYGVLLLLLAHYLLPRLAEDPEAEGFRMFRRAISICACFAIVVGLLTGTYLGDVPAHFFGLPSLALSETVHAVYMDPMVFIIVSLLIGLVHVNLGHLLMLVRGIRERKAHAILGRGAIFLIQITAIPLILVMLGVGWFQPGETVRTALFVGLLAGVLMVVVSALMEKGWFLGSILWIFDLSGILGDIMSYARLAGVGLATYFLAHSFNMMATLIANMLPEGIVRVVLGGAIMLVILVFGHLLNLLLSSITCFVHALRLCFVEFLFKFYEGGGRPYAPFRLRRREAFPVRAGGKAFH